MDSSLHYSFLINGLNACIPSPNPVWAAQLVKLVLNNGEVIRHYKVLNAERLLKQDGEDIDANDIADIRLETGSQI